MHSLHPELTRAMAVMLDKLDASLRAGGYGGPPVATYLAGGMAVHYHRENSVEWQGLGNETRAVQLRVFSPIDLAVSKISRFSEQDRNDILALAERGLFTASQLRTHAEEALQYYVGDTNWVRGTIDLICADIG